MVSSFSKDRTTGKWSCNKCDEEVSEAALFGPEVHYCVKRLAALQLELSQLPIVPLNLALRKKRDRVQKELMDIARHLNIVDKVNLQAGTVD